MESKQKIGIKVSNIPEGYVYVPYVIKELPGMVEDASKEWVRRMEIKKRNLKIKKILDGMGSV